MTYTYLHLLLQDTKIHANRLDRWQPYACNKQIIYYAIS